MFVCAFDVRQFSLRMVLTVKAPVPIFLEGHYFQPFVRPLRVLNFLKGWENFYEGAPDYLVGCPQDPWPVQLKEALKQAGYRIEWVNRDDIDKMVNAWKSLRPDARWLRGGIMSYLCPSNDRYQSSDELSHIQVMEWIYATLKDRIMNLEGKLIAEGRDMCPGHLINKCPLCETVYDEKVGPEDFNHDMKDV